MTVSKHINKSYEILGLSQNASREEIKTAYRDLASIWHPDRVSDQNPRLKKKAAEQFKKIREAYDILLKRHMPVKNSNFPEETGQVVFSNVLARPRRRKSITRTFLPFILLILGLSLPYHYRDQLLSHIQTWKEPLPLKKAESGEKYQTKLHERTAEKLFKPSPPAAAPIPDKKPGVREVMRSIKVIKESGKDATEIRSGNNRDQKLAEIREIDKPTDDEERQSIKKEQAAEKDLNESGGIIAASGAYMKFNGRLIDMEEYKRNSVLYKGKTRYYEELRDLIREKTESDIGAYLRSAYEGKIIHSKRFTFFKFRLEENTQQTSRYRVFYNYEIWTFNSMDRGNLAMDVEYDIKNDLWKRGEVSGIDLSR